MTQNVSFISPSKRVKFAGCPIIRSDFMGEKRYWENPRILKIVPFYLAINAPEDAHWGPRQVPVIRSIELYLKKWLFRKWA